MKILLTNDDGVNAEGINILYKELGKHHDVLVFAPDREQSATSHSLTLSRPLRIQRYSPNFYSCDGTPTDSVLLAVLKIMHQERPDMVVSGINHGANMGEDIMYSGTVAAAVEGAQLEIPSVAVSMVDAKDANFKGAAQFMRRFITLYPTLGISPATIMNINLPGKVKTGFKRFQFTFLGSRKYDDVILERTDPRGGDYYWIAGRPIWEDLPGSDINAIKSGAVSISPVHMHFTDSEVLASLKSAKIRLPR